MPHRDRMDIGVWQNVGLGLTAFQLTLNVCGSLATSEASSTSVAWAFALAVTAVALYLCQRRWPLHSLLLGWPTLNIVIQLVCAATTPQAASLSLGVFTLVFLYVAMIMPRWWIWVFVPPALACAAFTLDLPAAQRIVRLTTALLVWIVAAEVTAYLLRQLDARRMQIEEQAGRDILTGTRNRRDLASTLQTLDARSALVIIDVDDFKLVNDEQGHAAGDRLLSDLGRFLTEHIRDTDIVFRYGGDEFVVILPSIALEEAHELAHRLEGGWREISPTTPISCGVAIGGTDALQRADEALYAEKERRRALD
jgi:diguanylate cyclase (GGDEF)-like protein